MIAVIGDLMLDEFWFGTFTRFTPENNNTPILHINNVDKRLGGAANVALNISKLGKDVKLFGILGKDEAGLDILSLLNKHGIANSFITKNIVTTRKIRLYNGKNYSSRIDVEERLTYNQEELSTLLNRESLSYIVLSDYNKGAIQNPKELIENTKVKVFSDPKSSLENYSGSFVLKPNLNEFISWANIKASLDIEEFIYSNYFELIKARNKLNVDNLIITCGEDGCILITEKVRLFKAPETKTVDVTGAGDSFLAALVCKFKETDNIIKSIQYANLVASIAVSKRGTSYVEKREIN